MAAKGVRVKAAVAATGLAIAVAATGCTSSSKEAGSSPGTTAAGLPQAGVSAAATSAAAASMAAGTSAAASAAPSAAAAAPATSAAAGATSAAATSAPANNGVVEGRPAFHSDPTAGRSIIYTARVDLQVPKVADVATVANRIADAADDNGYVFSRSGQAAADPTTSAKPSDETATADLVLKVTPGGAYDDLLGMIQHQGKVLDVNEKTSDVTSQVVDTQSRLVAQRASVARIRALLDKATTIGQIVQVEGELTRREADLESLEGTLTVLKSQTALATITVHIESAPVPVPTATPTPTVPPKPKKHIHGFTGGLKAGSHSFVTGAVGVATVLGALLPYLALGLAIAIVVWLIRRSWVRGRRPNPPVEQVTP